MTSSPPSPKSWLALMIGNSRLHWAWFLDAQLRQTWDISHLSPQAIASLFTQSRRSDAIPDEARDLLLPLTLQPESPLWIASVVPSQTTLWQVYPYARVLRLNQVPLPGVYPSLGIDRALAVYGAAQTTGFPVLVIDAGTALTFTAADEQGRLWGGAIVAGLQTQWRSLAQNTAALPTVEAHDLPDRWAMNTPDAIRSGVMYTLLATIRDYGEAWLERFPGGAIALTGGDGAMLHRHLQTQFPALAARVTVDPNLIFWGMRSVCLSSF